MKYVVLGGGGSFGIHSSFHILKNMDPEKVIGIGRNPLRPSPFSLDIYKENKYEYKTFHLTYEMDLLLEYLDIEKPDYIINFAAQGEGAVSWKNSWRYFETNALALAKFTEELGKRSWLKKFIQIGTSEMYGSVTKPSKENDLIKPSSPYAASKVAFDLHLMSINKHLNFPMNVIRPSNAYCPGQLLHRVIPKAIVCGLTKQKLPLQGGGKSEKSYIHAKDLAFAIELVITKGLDGKIYNAGSKNPTSIKKVVELCATALEMNFEDLCEMAPERLGQDSCYWLDSSEIKKDTGWEPKISWEEGLQDMVNWGNKYLNQLVDWPKEYTFRG